MQYVRKKKTNSIVYTAIINSFVITFILIIYFDTYTCYVLEFVFNPFSQ